MCEVLAQIQWGVLLLNLLTMSRPKVDREGMALHVGIGPTHLGTWILFYQNLGVLNCHGSEKNISKSSNNPSRSLGHFRWIHQFFLSFRLSFSFTAQMTRAAHVICLPKTVNKNMTLCSDATGEVLIALRKFKKFAFLHVASLICAWKKLIFLDVYPFLSFAKQGSL